MMQGGDIVSLPELHVSGNGLTRRQQNELLLTVCRELHQRRPDFFQSEQRWAPGGVHELGRVFPVLTDAVQIRHATPEAADWRKVVEREVCSRCQHQTRCGYCLVRDRGACVLLEEADWIMRRIRDAMNSAGWLRDASRA